MARSWFSSAVGANIRKGMPFAAAVRAARGMRLPARRNPGTVQANPENPWTRGYQFWSPRARKVVKVGSYWKPKGSKSRGRKPRARGFKRMTRHSRMAYLGHLGAMARATRRKAASNPRRRRSYRRNPPFTYQVGPVTANPRRRRYRRRSFRYNPPFTYTVGPVTANSPRRRRMRRNPYAAASPFMAGFEGVDVFANPMVGVASIKDFAMGFTKPEWLTRELLPMGGGLVGTKILTGYLLPKMFTKDGVVDAAKKEKWLKWKPLFEAAVAIGLGGVVGIGLKKTDIAVRLATGGLVGALISWIERQDWYKDKAVKPLGEIDLGQVSTTMKSELAKAVQREIKKAEAGMTGVEQWEEEEDEGVEAFATTRDMQGAVGAFATDEEMGSPSDGMTGMTVEGFLAEPSI